MKYMKPLLIMLTLFGISSWCFAGENRYQHFNEEVQKAYSFYRVALFQTNKNNVAKSQEATAQFLKGWKEIITTFSNNPPEVFSTDPEWNATLDTISTIASNSQEQIKGEELKKAHETLEGIRDELSDLRKRNGVIVFSDHINGYHGVMEELLSTGYSADKIGAEAIVDIEKQLAVLDYLAANIKENAPKNYRDNKKYQQLEQNLFASLDLLKKALAENTPEKISKAIKALKPAYAKLFLNFG